MSTEADLAKLAKKGITVVGDKTPQLETPQTLSHPLPNTEVLSHINHHSSSPEYRFALHYLEKRVEDGTSVGYAHEPLAIRMVGQTYTPDFIEWTADGRTLFYEVKGSAKIPSQDRSSAKYRMTAAMFELGTIEFWWAKEKRQHGQFTIKKLPMQGKRKKHQFLNVQE